VPKDASVCLRCRLRINRSLPPQTPHAVLPVWQNARTQSTAAAVVEDVDEYGEEPRKEHRPSKKSKKQLRRVWKPPRVAELGVSSLGKPAEVLVLKDRDRHVPAAAKDEAKRSKTSEPRILEALQAENLPLSSESVRWSLDQISDPYRSKSRALSARERTELRKKLIVGFTQDQLLSYSMGGGRPNLVSPTDTQASDSKIQRQTLRPPGRSEGTKNNTKPAKVGPKLAKAALVDHILKHKWQLTSLGDEQTEQRTSVPPQKLECMMSRKQLSSEQYGKQFDVAIDASRDDGNIGIKGKLKHVLAAQADMRNLLKDIQVSRVRSVTTGNDLEKFATSAFLDHLTHTYNVPIDWASKRDKNISRQTDWLTICYHKMHDLRDALNAERAILLAEREFYPVTNSRLPQEKVSMWLSEKDVQPHLVLHQAPKASNVSNRQGAWARWVTPQQPMQMEYNDPGADSPLHQLNKHWFTLNKHSDALCKLLKGQNDEFFFEMPLKKQPAVRDLINTDGIKEEIFAHLGKILLPNADPVIANSFKSRYNKKETQILTAKRSVSTLLSPDLPGVPNFLKLLSPVDETGQPLGSAEGKDYERKYRLRYVPMTSQLPCGIEVPPIEIDILKNGKPGSAIANHVTNAWAIMHKQSHKLLTPRFAFDLEFVRRLKRRLLRIRVGKNGRYEQATWLKEFEEQIQRSDSDQFPPFLTATLPEYTVRYAKPEHGDVVDSRQPTFTKYGSDRTGDALGSIEPHAITTPEDAWALKTSPTKVDFILESWELIHSRSYKQKALFLEHLSLEGMDASGTQELLRLAPQPLLQSQIKQTILPALLERSFKLAGQMSDPRRLGLSGELAHPANKTHQSKPGNELKEAEENVGGQGAAQQDDQIGSF